MVLLFCFSCVAEGATSRSILCCECVHQHQLGYVLCSVGASNASASKEYSVSELYKMIVLSAVSELNNIHCVSCCDMVAITQASVALMIT